MRSYLTFLSDGQRNIFGKRASLRNFLPSVVSFALVPRTYIVLNCLLCTFVHIEKLQIPRGADSNWIKHFQWWGGRGGGGLVTKYWLNRTETNFLASIRRQ